MSGTFDFLVLGAGRGGTSLLAGLLDAHPRLEVAFEAHAQACLMGQALPAVPRASLLESRVRAFVDACRADAAQAPARSWGNKITTEQLFALEDHNRANPDAQVDILEYFFNHALRGVKIVFILRDGRTCVRSKLARTGQALDTACERWRFCVRVYRFLRARHAANHCLKYEDLLRDPRVVLEQVCAFLQVPYTDAMLAGTRNAKMLPEYRQAGLLTEKLGLDNVPPGCAERIQDELRECGYI